MNAGFNNITIDKPVHTGLCTTFRHILALVSFALLSMFSTAAVSGSVHKCLQANGLYEYSDTKCISVPPSAVQKQSASVTESHNGETNRADPTAAIQPHEATNARAPVESQPPQINSGSAVPTSAPI